MQKPTQKLAHVYAIQNELGLVKIGFAHNPTKRFKAIEANSGLKIVDSHVGPICFHFAEIEKSLHNQFAAYRKAGEWFNIDFITVKNAIDTHFLPVDSHELTTPALKALIPISQTQIGTETIQAVDARELHQWLESKQQFSDWIKNRIDKYGFIEGQDFTVHKFMNEEINGLQIKQTDYLISLDMAKELSMVERTPKGKEARQYFIACEKALRNPGQSLNESTKAFIYAAVKQVVVEALQTAQTINSDDDSDNDENRDLEDIWGFNWQRQWERKIMAFLAGYENPTFTLKTIATDCLGIKNLDRATEMSIGKILKRLGYIRIQIQKGNIRKHFYRSTW